MKCLLLLLFIAVTPAAVSAQNLVKLEYFFDQDPGFGKGFSLSDFSQSNDIPLSFTANTGSLSPGIHQLYIRMQDSNGKWGHTIRRIIEVPLAETRNLLVAAEYFFDTDPGIGLANRITGFNQDKEISLNMSAATASLSPGFHQLYVRTLDAKGRWSLTVRRTVEVLRSAFRDSVVALEYFFGSDPGVGNARLVTLNAAAADSSFNLLIPQSMIRGGMDTLYIRSRDNINQCWSLTTWTIKDFQLTSCSLPSQPALVADTGFCAGGIAKIEIDTVYGATGYTWQLPGDWLLQSGQGSEHITVQLPAVTHDTSYELYVAAVNGCGTGQARSITTMVHALPEKPVVQAGGPTSFCEGDTLTLTSSSAFAYQWLKNGQGISGQNTGTFKATTGGNYTVRVSNAHQCSIVSDILLLKVHPHPPRPVIKQTGLLLVSDADEGNQWFLNGIAIPGANGRQYIADSSGVYTVQVTLNGCVSPVSDSVHMLIPAGSGTLQEDDVILYPNPVNSLLYILNRRTENIRIVFFDVCGRKILERESLPPGRFSMRLSHLKRGCYWVKISNDRLTYSIMKLIFKGNE